MDSIKSDADVKHTWVAALSHEQVHASRSTAPSRDDFENYGSQANAVITKRP